MSWIWMNLFFGLIAIAFTVGLPLWVMLKYSEDVVPEAEAPPAEERQYSEALLPESGVLVS
jgi:hypothetical protein